MRVRVYFCACQWNRVASKIRMSAAKFCSFHSRRTLVRPSGLAWVEWYACHMCRAEQLKLVKLRMLQWMCRTARREQDLRSKYGMSRGDWLSRDYHTCVVRCPFPWANCLSVASCQRRKPQIALYHFPNLFYCIFQIKRHAKFVKLECSTAARN